MTQRQRQWQPVSRDGKGPASGGAYSPGVRAGGFVFVSGQIPRDPATGELKGDDIESQTRSCMANVQSVLEAAGASLADVVSVIVYLANVDDWGRFNTVYKEIMAAPYPTRTAVGADLRGILIEISAVAFIG
jgi:2-iminobutanoate/2-iminopropanoate deaminase